MTSKPERTKTHTLSSLAVNYETKLKFLQPIVCVKLPQHDWHCVGLSRLPTCSIDGKASIVSMLKIASLRQMICQVYEKN